MAQQRAPADSGPGAPRSPLPAQACADTERNQLILAQVALLRLYDNCAQLDDNLLRKTRNVDCLAASKGALPPLLLPPRGGFAWQRLPGEPELRYLLRLLAIFNFEFHDLGLRVDQADEAPARVRDLLDELGNALASAQPGAAWRIVGLGARIAIDTITQLPTPLVWFATLAETLEGGLSWLLPVPTNQSWRIHAAVLVDGLGRIITSNSGKLAVGAGIGPEWEPHTWSSSMLQTRLLLRGGYLFGQGDNFASRSCANPQSEQLGNCSRMVVQGGLGVTVLENLRVQVIGTWYPPLRPSEANLWEVTPGVGVQF